MGVTETQDHFTRVYEAVYADLVRFVVRRAGGDVAEDIAAEVLTVAWRRVHDLPDDIGQARAWVFGIARRVLLAHHRTSRGAFSVELGAVPVPGHEDTVAVVTDLVRAWQRLPARHQEALALTVWEGLSGAQAADVLGISPVAYRVRLSRARTSLRALIDHQPPAPAPVVVALTDRSTR